MYERFTDRARKVMQLANKEAVRFNHEYIGTEHILLGLVSEGTGVAANVLRNLNVDLRKVRNELERIVQHGPGGDEVVMGRLPHTPRVKKVFEYASEESKALRHNYIGTEHLLLGLIREQEGVASQVLMNSGLKLEDVRAEVMNLLGPVPTDATDQSSAKPIATTATDRPRSTPTPSALANPEPEDVMAEHIGWLGDLLDRANTYMEFELAADIRKQRAKLLAFRRKILGES